MSQLTFHSRIVSVQYALAEHVAALRINPKLAVAYANRGLAYEDPLSVQAALERLAGDQANIPIAEDYIDRDKISHLAKNWSDIWSGH